MIAVLVTLLMAGMPAQTPRDVRLAVTVVDQTGAVIQNATVTVTPSTDPKTPVAPVQTGEKGVATLQGLSPGRYSIHAEFSGFEPRLLKDVSLKAGDNKHVVVLALQGVQDTVTVSRDAREAASDRRATFGTAMTREQIDALSDDPDEMAQQLQDIAGGNAVIRVDSFEGGRLPPKSAIKAIHITRDAFAAENHYAGGLFIDIITQPGIGPLRTNLNMRLRAGALSGKNRARRGQGARAHAELQRRSVGLADQAEGVVLDQPKHSGPVRDAGLVRAGSSTARWTTPSARAGRRTTSSSSASSTTPSPAIRPCASISTGTTARPAMLGVGGYDAVERGYTTQDEGDYFRIQEAGPIGRRFFINTRANIGWADSSNHSVFEGQTIRVLDEFTTGGAAVEGAAHAGRSINLQSDLDYVRGIHSVRTGLQVEGGTYHSDDSSNYLGTYTFESLDAFRAGTPRSFTRRIGDPNIDYRNIQAGIYLQDDIRVRKNLTLSPGIRYELQTHLSDVNNFGPRFGVTWSPGKSGKTTLRGSAGIFYDWLSTGTYEQTLRVDGFRQREVNITNPPFPYPGPAGPGSPTNRYLLGDDLRMQRFTRLSAGFDRAVTKGLRVNVLYAHTSGDNLLRGLNLNAPVDGLRPDPTFSNVVEVLDDAESRQNTVNVGVTLNLNTATPGPAMFNGGGGMIMMIGPPPPPPPGGGGAANPANRRWNWRRLNVFTNLGLGRSLNNTEGAFNIPATGHAGRRLGTGQQRRSAALQRRHQQQPAAQPQREPQHQRVQRSAVHHSHRHRRQRRPRLQRSSPRCWTQHACARPASGRSTGSSTMAGRSASRSSVPAGISFRNDGGGLAVSQAAAQSTGRYRLSLNVNVQNLTNHGNLIGYTGTLTSINFGQPTTVAGHAEGRYRHRAVVLDVTDRA